MINHPRRSRRAVAVAAAPAHDHDADYAALLDAVIGSFEPHRGAPLFRTDADGLFDAYLATLPAERDVHTCSACRRFINDFGGLVTLDDKGRTSSPFWCDDVPDFYKPAMAALRRAATKARVVSPFLSADKTWGLPHTGPWTHFAVKAPAVFKHALLTPGQAMAAKREDFGTVARALADFSAAHIAEAIRLLDADALSRSERFVSPLRWLAALHTARASLKGPARDNVLWLAIATAPDGYCHPRAGMTGTLLEDIAAGMPFAEVKARWEAKVHPLRYQRPQAPPSAGNIAEGERIVGKLGIARSLERRFARLDEIEAIWRPAADVAAEGGGVFGHLKAKGVPAAGVDLPTQTMTWEKFARVVLPEAEKIEAHLNGNMAFTTFTTAAHADAPPIIRWDREEARNPVSWYLWHGGSRPEQFGLSAGWNAVAAISSLPTMWGATPSPHLGEGFVLMVKDAKESRNLNSAMFPEHMRPELHGVRATIEAHSASRNLVGGEDGTASGLDIRKGAPRLDYRLRVTSGGRIATYLIDRWD